jgi:NAD+ diphosphatase
MSTAQSPPPLRPFTGVTLDRLHTGRKDPELVAELLADPTARAVVAGRDGVVMTDGTYPALVRTVLTPQAAHEPVLLGLERGRALFALDLDSLEARARAGLTAEAGVVSLREAGTVLAHHEAGLAAYAAALLNWHRRHGFCPNCGSATTIAEAGYSRHCPVCGAVHFPRTDPVVIMTVEHRGKLLLGRRTAAPPDRYSVLAGFVSPGESAEEAVIREVAEESGIVTRDPSFVTSQPWPFPSSLMLGFDAQSDGGHPEARDGELEDVRWVAADEVQRALDGGHPELKLPPSVSVARFLIERWVDRHRRRQA